MQTNRIGLGLILGLDCGDWLGLTWDCRAVLGVQWWIMRNQPRRRTMIQFLKPLPKAWPIMMKDRLISDEWQNGKSENKHSTYIAHGWAIFA